MGKAFNLIMCSCKMYRFNEPCPSLHVQMSIHMQNKEFIGSNRL